MARPGVLLVAGARVLVAPGWSGGAESPLSGSAPGQNVGVVAITRWRRSTEAGFVTNP